MKATALLLLLPALLVGCSKEPGAGVSAESSDSTSRESKNSLARSKEVTAGNTAKASIKMPAAGLIADAMGSYFSAIGGNVDQTVADFTNAATINEWTPLRHGAVPSVKELSGVKDWAPTLADFDKRIAAHPAISNVLKARRSCAEKASQGDFQGAHICYEHAANVSITAAAVAVANMSQQGWPVNPNSSKGDAFTYAMTITAEYANLVETELAGALQGRALRDPDNAKTAILEAILAMPPETFVNMAKQANTVGFENMKKPVLDLASGKGIKWVGGNTTYSNSGVGWSISRNGMTWFGDGRLSGKAYELDLESSVAANMTKRQSIDNATTSTSSEQQKADAQVK